MNVARTTGWSIANISPSSAFDVTGVDLSVSGIALGRESFPHLKLNLGNVYRFVRNLWSISEGQITKRFMLA
jgi:hypothetical protein